MLRPPSRSQFLRPSRPRNQRSSCGHACSINCAIHCAGVDTVGADVELTRIRRFRRSPTDPADPRLSRSDACIAQRLARSSGVSTAGHQDVGVDMVEGSSRCNHAPSPPPMKAEAAAISAASQVGKCRNVYRARCRVFALPIALE